jgi:hypothetical protein
MALLHLPLTITPSGVFERAESGENNLDDRLRLFLLSGMGQYLRLPSPGIRALWIQLYTMGPSGRFRDVFSPEDRETLENTIREEANVWLEETASVLEVKLLGDELEDNGIRFVSDRRDTLFRFKYARPGTVGCWNITEESHATQ